MPDDKQSQNQQLLEASSLGLMFPIAIGLGFAAGYGLDKLFHTGPWLTWIFTGFGVIAAFINLFRIGMRNNGGTPPRDGA
jgi:F0F1-type ATP synthase assembly protein I